MTAHSFQDLAEQHAAAALIKPTSDGMTPLEQLNHEDEGFKINWKYGHMRHIDQGVLLDFIQLITEQMDQFGKEAFEFGYEKPTLKDPIQLVGSSMMSGRAMWDLTYSQYKAGGADAMWAIYFYLNMGFDRNVAIALLKHDLAHRFEGHDLIIENQPEVK